ncbi:nuclease-related domain-containing protein [Gracilibacillus dipsosauri]|uniref:nuclease-related domain-containing protein n=1 Tax=Gracilibacillus dipsosauri TaxID=178340 RepID=UPI003D359A23
MLDAGRYGENSLDYYFDLCSIEGKKVIKDLRIVGKTAFQIDRLLLTPSFLCLLEVKNITGTIYFDQDAHQLYGETEDKNDIFPDPLLQVDLQKAQLRRFLLEYSIDIPPIFTASVFVHPNARLLLQDYSERSRILTGIALPSYLEKLAKKYPPVITSHQVELLSRFLESHHQSAVINILEKYEVLWEDLIKGVRCPSCNQYAMKRNRMRWECPHVEHVVKKHIYAHYMN